MPVSPVKTGEAKHVANVAVATVRGEGTAAAAPPEATTAPVNCAVDSRPSIVVAVKSCELLTAMQLHKQLAIGVSCVATDVKTVLVAFVDNVEVAVLGVAVLTFPVKQVDTQFILTTVIQGLRQFLVGQRETVPSPE